MAGQTNAANHACTDADVPHGAAVHHSGLTNAPFPATDRIFETFGLALSRKLIAVSQRHEVLGRRKTVALASECSHHALIDKERRQSMCQ